MRKVEKKTGSLGRGIEDDVKDHYRLLFFGRGYPNLTITIPKGYPNLTIMISKGYPSVCTIIGQDIRVYYR